MQIKECYSILHLPMGAGQEDIKKAYRALAFKLHPDLNPGDARAADEFTRLNQAYVTLKNHLEKHGEPSTSRKGGAKASPRTRRSIFKNNESLSDILEDPFAQEVFEDILKKARARAKQFRETTIPALKSRTALARVREQAVESLQNIFAGLLKDHKTIRTEARNLIPGGHVRFVVREGSSGTPRSYEITLPPHFSPNRPVRLKRLGKKLGPFRGDLYLTVMPK
ncbi:MAG TPA: DnaJ domain-containing protein [Desulfomicrobiaceae bacterium]|nr:DnaJ domain-containing protein [Desulfomicrobiaceae bacterium]